MAVKEKVYKVAKRDLRESKKSPAPTVLHTGLKRTCLEGDLLPKEESPFAKATRLLLGALQIKQEPVEIITIADVPPAVAPQQTAAAASARQLQRNARQRRRDEKLFGPEEDKEPQLSTSAGPPAPPPDSTNWAEDEEGELRIDDPSDYTDSDSHSDLEAEEDLINNTQKIVLSDK